jgi:hypothetical protein
MLAASAILLSFIASESAREVSTIGADAPSSMLAGDAPAK